MTCSLARTAAVALVSLIATAPPGAVASPEETMPSTGAAHAGAAAAQPGTAAAARAQQTAPFAVTRTGAGRPMILIPGLLSGGDVWDATVAALRDEYELHVLTLAGFAGVPPTGADPYLATTRDALIAYIRDHELDQPVLMGHSLGGFLALWTAATAPDLVGAVIAVDGVPFLTALGDTTMTATQATAQAEATRVIFSGMSMDALAAQTRMALTQQARDTAWHTRGGQWGAASDPATAGRAVAEMMTTDIRDDVARITSPVLLFMAAGGMPAELRATMLDRYRGQLSKVPDARVVAADDARHFIMLDDPDFLHATVRAFLEAR
ncbi:MAG TPA: alpha/beta hydrolase [Longimicrobiales bacterium]|nr:alpha/beta hydrolase [Longimicrobiales bacterium]